MTHSANNASTYLDVPSLPIPTLSLYPAPSLSPIPQSPHVFGASSNPNINDDLDEPDAYDSDISPGLGLEPVIPPFAGHVSFLNDLEGHAGLASPKKARVSGNGQRNRKSSANSMYSSAPSVRLSPSILSHSPSLKVFDLGLGPEIETDFFDDLPCGPQTPTLRAPVSMRLRRALSYSTFSPGSSLSTAASFMSTEVQTPVEREGDRESGYGFPPLPPVPAQMPIQPPVRQRRVTLATSGTGNSASGEMDKQRFAPHSIGNVNVQGSGRPGQGQQQRRGPVVPLTISISRPFDTSPSRSRGDKPLPVVPFSSSTSTSTSVHPQSTTRGQPVAGPSEPYDSIPVPMTAVSVESSTPTITVSAIRRSSSATAASGSVSLPITGSGAAVIARPTVPPRNPNRPRSFVSVSAASDGGTELPTTAHANGGGIMEMSSHGSGADAPPRPSISTESTLSSLGGPFLTPPEWADAEYDIAFAHLPENGAGSHDQNGGQTLEVLCMSPVSECESTTSAASSPLMPLTPDFNHHGQHRHQHSLPLPLPLPAPSPTTTMNPLPRPPRSPLRGCK